MVTPKSLQLEMNACCVCNKIPPCLQRFGEPPQCHVLFGVCGAHVCRWSASPCVEAVFHAQQSHS